jgi:uncharacterized protein
MHKELPTISNNPRNSIFDILKGIAVILMVVANSAPVFGGDLPFILRIFFSMAAPIFVMMSGFMVAFIRNKHPFSYFLLKAVFILSLAVLIDIFVNKIKPFEGFDVLYLIGFSIPFAALFVRLPLNLLGIFIIAIIAAGSILRATLGYASNPIMNDIQFSNFDFFPTTIPFKNWLLDGWFPILPWFGFMLIGVFICKIYTQKKILFSSLIQKYF